MTSIAMAEDLVVGQSAAGAVDLVWPVTGTLEEFASTVASCLATKGWAAVQMSCAADRRKEAAAKARRLPDFDAPRTELVEEYLGRGGRGKIAWMPPDDGRRPPRHALAELDRELTELSAALAPSTPHLGFQCGGRSRTMAWLSFSCQREAKAWQHEPIDDMDVRNGLVEEHLKLVRYRRLWLMHVVECEEGDALHLHANGSSSLDSTELPVEPGRLFVFHCDAFVPEYRPIGKSVVLQTWICEPPEMLRVTDVRGSAFQMTQIFGVKRGPEVPQGDQIRVMSASCKLPGAANDISQCWNMYVSGTDAHTKIPYTRFDTDVYCTKDESVQPGKCYTMHTAFLDDDHLIRFDNKMFDIPSEDAELMAPSQRVIMQAGYECLHGAGYKANILSGQHIGVFLGDTGSDWIQYPLGDASARGGMREGTMHGTSIAISANRLSHTFNLKGPTGHSDTACSSSLVAVGVATFKLRSRGARSDQAAQGGISEALACGIATHIGAASYIGMCSIMALSFAGRCFTFDQSADGYERGEGFGACFLRGSDAHDDRQEQIACVLGVAINQDGRSATMTAPHGPSQQDCIKQSLRQAQLSPQQITIAECHGTGTALGDPIEVGALRNCMEERSTPLLGVSSKSFIGHLEGGAGITGLLKCLEMLSGSLGPPNVHLNQLNPHLGVEGWPILFDSEAVDTGLNSGISGVSSFGWGGTNARGDVWAQARTGARATQPIARVLEVESARAGLPVSITCPVTMGPIDVLTGEPILGSWRSRKAAVLREEGAPYDISSYAYTGEFRFRGGVDHPDSPNDMAKGFKVWICGSWDGRSKEHEMKSEKDGWFSSVVQLGESRCESFALLVGKGKDRTPVYPAVDKAAHHIWIMGPDGDDNGRSWMIDGRDANLAPAGSLFFVRFKLSSGRKLISWEQVGEEHASRALPSDHAYFLVGSFSSWRCATMKNVVGEEGAWEASFQIGASGEEQLHFLRDADPRQAVYPSAPRATKSSVPVRGPDDLGKGKNWLVKGPPGDFVRVRLQIIDAWIAVTISSETKGGKVWESRDGFARHSYSVHGAFGDRPFTVLEPLKKIPGVFKCRVQSSSRSIDALGWFADLFRVVVDEDLAHAMYPATPHSQSGKCIVMGPDSGGDGSCFALRSPTAGSTFEIVLNLQARDRRKVVTWTVVGAQRVLEGGR